MGKPMGQQLVDWCMKLRGKPYVFGTEQDGKPVDKITKEDCSEMIQNCCDQNGVVPKMPDGARFQLKHCRNHGLEIDLNEDAFSTPGVLLFIGDPAHHVAMAKGVREKVIRHNLRTGKVTDMGVHWTTIEAKGKDWGVVVDISDWSRFDYAALIPGVDYGPEWED